MNATTIEISRTYHVDGGESVVLGAFPTGSSKMADRGRPSVPLFVPRGQSYFWTLKWQQGESEALVDLSTGNVRRFGTGREAAEWLLGDDAD